MIHNRTRLKELWYGTLKFVVFLLAADITYIILTHFGVIDTLHSIDWLNTLTEFDPMIPWIVIPVLLIDVVAVLWIIHENIQPSLDDQLIHDQTQALLNVLSDAKPTDKIVHQTLKRIIQSHDTAFGRVREALIDLGWLNKRQDKAEIQKEVVDFLIEASTPDTELYIYIRVLAKMSDADLTAIDIYRRLDKPEGLPKIKQNQQLIIEAAMAIRSFIANYQVNNNQEAKEGIIL